MTASLGPAKRITNLLLSAEHDLEVVLNAPIPDDPAAASRRERFMQEVEADIERWRSQAAALEVNVINEHYDRLPS